MTEAQLRKKVKEMIAIDKVELIKSMERAIASGCMNIEAATDDYILPKSLLSAMYKNAADQTRPFDKPARKVSDRIYLHL